MENNLTPEAVKEALDKVNYSEVINKIASNSDEAINLVSQSAEYMTPEMMEKAKNYANGSQGKQIKEEMNRQNINNKDMREQMAKQKKMYTEATNRAKGESKKAILITSSKIAKPKDIHPKILESEVKKIIGSDYAVEISCSRLAVGPLSGKNITVWYDPNRKGNNNRASKIVDFKIAGELLIIMAEGDLLEKDFKSAESQML